MGDNVQVVRTSSSKEQHVTISVVEGEPYKEPRFDSGLDQDVESKSKKFASSYADELEKIQIITIELEDNRELHLIDEQDVVTYNKIHDFAKENPHATLIETAEHFQKYPTGDAIAKVLLKDEHPDYILKYRDDNNPVNKLKRGNFERLLLRSGLILEHEFDAVYECTYIKVFAPFERLCEQAQIIKLKMRLDPHYLPEIELDPPKRNIFHPITKYFKYEVNFAKGSAFFRRDRLRQFEGAGPEKSVGDIILNFFPTIRRIFMVNRILVTANQINEKTYDDDDEKPIVVKRTIKSLAIKNLVNDGTFMDFYPIHDGPPIEKDKPLEQMNLRAQLNKLWVQPRGKQPIEKIRLYFGEKLALYFVWLGFYTTWLAVASILGIIVVIYGLTEYYSSERSERSEHGRKDFSVVWDNALTAPFAFLMAVWSTCYLETWKRFNASVAYDWDVLEYEREELPRPDFYGTVLKKSPITLKQEIHFPYRERVTKLLISGIVVFISVLIVIVSVTILLLAPKLWINLGAYTSWVTAITNLVIIFFMNMLYSYVADWLTSFENHRTETSYEDALTVKSYFFDFVNCYSGLIYILVFKQKFIKNIIKHQGITGCEYDNCMADLSIQLATILTGKQLFGQFNEVIWPWVRSIRYKRVLQEGYVKAKKTYQSSTKHIGIPQWARDDKLFSSYGYERAEYGEMVVQFGFISLFGIAFPLAPFFAWINNVIEIRSDAFKYVFSLQRPIGMQAQDIGVWEYIFGFVSLLSVVTNSLIMAFHSTWMRHKFESIYGDDENQILVARLLFVLVFEHLVFLIKFVFAYMIPDIPKEIQYAIERERYFAKVALEDETPALDEHLSKSADDSSLFDDSGELKLPKRRRAFNAEEDVA